MSHLGSGEVDGGEQRQLQVASQSHESSLVPGYSQAPVWGWGACQSPRSCSLESPSTQPLVRAVPIVLFSLHWVGLGKWEEASSLPRKPWAFLQTWGHQVPSWGRLGNFLLPLGLPSFPYPPLPSRKPQHCQLGPKDIF